MTDKELIKQEIERRIDLYSIAEKENSTFACMGALSSIIDYIDSLSEESGCEVSFTTKSEDLEEYYKKEFLPNEWFAKPGQRTISQFNFFTAKHFAEWQKQQDEKLFKDDSWNYIEENYPNITQEEKFRLYDISIKSRLTGANTIKQHMKEALQTEYEKGRFDIKEEMMKNAVECVVEDWCGDSPEITIPLNPQDFKMGDKVKIIIVKEEQQ